MFQLAQRLVFEVAEKMAGIKMACCSQQQMTLSPMHGVHGTIEGDCQINVYFRAEPRLFQRLARNMIGDEPENSEQLREYAIEFANVLFGRFVSELVCGRKPPVRFKPGQFKLFYEQERLETGETRCVLWFSTEEREHAEFSWTEACAPDNKNDKE